MAERLPCVTVYRAKDGWRWRMVAGGRCIAESGEAYTERNKCVRALRSVFGAPVLMYEPWAVKVTGDVGFLNTLRMIRLRFAGRP